MTYIGAIDAGGTSWRCAIMHRDAPKKILARCAFPTTTPAQTLTQAVEFFQQQSKAGYPITHLGVGCFGPVSLDRQAHDWGYILETPKLGWSGTSIAGALSQQLGCPVLFETDVNAAAYGERTWGAGQGHDHLAYVTVGTGIGAGILLNGQAVHGALHPEVGHIYAPRHPQDQTFEGVCHIHCDCLEGLASAPALQARWGMDPADLPDDHPAWDIEAHYLGHLALTLILTTAVPLIIFGGGVSARAGLIPRVAAKTKALLGQYSLAARCGVDIEIVPACLGLDAGLIGAGTLAQVL